MKSFKEIRQTITESVNSNELHTHLAKHGVVAKPDSGLRADLTNGAHHSYTASPTKTASGKEAPQHSKVDRAMTKLGYKKSANHTGSRDSMWGKQHHKSTIWHHPEDSSHHVEIHRESGMNFINVHKH